MVHRRHREEIAIFSTSFLDLLFCGLAAVVLLWVLLEEPVEPEEPADYAFVTFRQKGSSTQGVWHFAEIVADGIAYEVFDDEGKKNAVSEYLNAKGVGLSETQGTADGFAGSLTLSVKPDAQPCSVSIKFEDCRASGFHVLHLIVETLRGRQSHSMLFDADTTKAAVPPGALLSDSTDVGNLFAEYEDGGFLTFQIEVDPGRVNISVVQPTGHSVPWRDVANN